MGSDIQGDGITDLLLAPGKLKDTIPSISGTRNLRDNLSDLKAQVAANNKGIGLVEALIGEFGLPVVQAYMQFIQVLPHRWLSMPLQDCSTRHACSSQAVKGHMQLF